MAANLITADSHAASHGGGAPGSATRTNRRRRPPSPKEQARRKAQMTALGKKTGALIREAIARSER